MEDREGSQITTPLGDLTLSALEVGTVVGSYRIARSLGVVNGHNEYLAHVAIEGEEEEREPDLRLIEGLAGTLEHIRRLEQFQLRHPRLLALRDFLTEGERDYAVFDIPGHTWPVPVANGLAPEEALAVGVIIGEALLYLHSRGVAHLHIDTSQVLVTTAGVFLAGIEHATAIDPGESLDAALIARDANQLAQTIGTFEGIPHVGNEADLALTSVVATGTVGGFTRVQDVMTECLRALPDGLPKLSEEAAIAPLMLLVGHATTIGMVREQNQDAIGVLAMEILDDQPEATPGGVFLVADGMGGEAQGEVASRIAARIIVAEVARRFLGPAARSTASDTPRDEPNAPDAATTMHLDSIAALTEAFRAANARIRNMGRRLDRATGTTATAVMLFGHEALIGHVGDSRAYLFRNGELHQLTRDHSLLQKLIELGQYREGDSEFSVPRNYLYRSLGQTDEMEVDTRVVKVGAGDSFVICSDGLWDLVTDEEIRETLSHDSSPTEAARELVRRANTAGGHDNSTAVIVRLGVREPV